MFRKMSGLLLILFLICIAFTSQADTKGTYQVGFLLDIESFKTTTLLQNLQAQIKAVVGEDAVITFAEQHTLYNNSNLQLATKNYQKLLSSEADIIIAFGVINNEVVSKQKSHEKPTILFGAVNRDLNEIDIKNKTSGIKNFTYLIESESYKEDLTRFYQLTQFKKVGVLIDEAMVEFLPLDETLNLALEGMDASFKLIPFKTITGIESQIQDVDAVYLAGGFFLTEPEVKQLANIFIKNKLPSFTLNGVNHVDLGLMATNQSAGNIDQFFRRVSLMVEAYISGVPMADMLVYIDYTPRLTVNYNTAEAVGVPIKLSLISNIDFVGEFRNAKSTQEYDLIDVINQAIDKNLNLASAKLNIKLNEQNVRLAKSAYLPSVGVSVSGNHVDQDTAAISNGTNPEYSTSGNLSVSQTLFSESNNASIKIQKYLKDAEVESFNTQQLNTIYDAIDAYFSILILKSNAKIQLQNLKLTNKNLQLASQSFEVGQSGKSDVLRFTSQKAQNTQSLVEAANRLEQSFITINQLLDNPLSYEIDIKDIRLDQGVFKKYQYQLLVDLLDDPRLREPFIDYLILQAKSNAPEIKEIDFNILATQRDFQANGSRRFLPTVSLQAEYNKTFNRSGVGDMSTSGSPLLDDNQRLMLNFSIPIFNRNQFRIKRQIAAVQIEQLEINKTKIKQTVDANIRIGVLNLINEISNIQLSEVSEATAKESLEMTQNQYAAGAVNVVNLIDSQNNYIQAQLAKTNAVYNFLANALLLERHLGQYFLLNTQQQNDQFKQDFFDYFSSHNNHQESVYK